MKNAEKKMLAIIDDLDRVTGKEAFLIREEV